MAAQLTLATLSDLQRLIPLVAAFHAEEGIKRTDAQREKALRPLLRGSPLGEVHLIGPMSAPIGYIAVSHGYSIEFGGPDAFIDELYIRPAIRGRGMGSDVIEAIATRLRDMGTHAVHLEVHRDNRPAEKLYQRKGFARRSSYTLMTRDLS